MVTAKQMRLPSPVRPERSSPIFTYLLVVFGILLGAAVLYEYWLMHSDFMAAARKQILSDPRVRPEFGDDVRLRAALGWRSHGAAMVFGYVSGAKAYGFAPFMLRNWGRGWIVDHGELEDASEDHILNLTPMPGAAPANRLHGHAEIHGEAKGKFLSPQSCRLTHTGARRAAARSGS